MSTGLIRLQKVTTEKLKLAKWMRSHMTLAEKCFWNGVKTDKFMGLHFRRQQIIHGFIADFYCEDLNLVVEVDGGIHEQQKDYDKLRTTSPSLPLHSGEGSRQAGRGQPVRN